MEINPNGYAGMSGQVNENNLGSKKLEKKSESFLNAIRSGNDQTGDSKDKDLDQELILKEEDTATHFLLAKNGDDFAQSSIYSLNSDGDGVDVLVDQKWFATGKLSYKISTFMERKDRNAMFSHTASREIPVATNVNTLSKSNTVKPDANQLRNNPLNNSKFIEGTTSSIVTKEQITSIRRKSGVSLPEYLKKKITIIEKDDEIEVLVRDYSVDKDMLKQTVQTIEEKLELSGSKAKKIVINGKLAEELK
ncbi:hypothetical protein TDB9533_02880 [Thalassocella blandensis]|nr:hypothetical protein TDB9533_02880 [Thalassocella blandensis]